MELLAVECLQCGTTRMARRDEHKHHFESPECPECGYLGWTPALQRTKPARAKRRGPRRVARRLHVVA
jgi:ssDNA-binding Zn-finger/Zn-ribbon topoisomerase 1